MPKPRATTKPIPTAARPPKIKTGIDHSAVSGHSAWMTYAPPDAQNPPSPNTTLEPIATRAKQKVKSSQEAADPR